MPSTPLNTHASQPLNTTTTPFPSPSPSPSASLLPSRSPLTRLPSLHSSATLSTPSFTSLQHPSSSKLLPSWGTSDRGDPASSRQSESQRSVRWSDSKHGRGRRRSSLLSGKKSLDPQQMWARYTQTVMPPFHLHEPSSGKFVVGGGCGLASQRSGRRPLAEIDEDSKYVMKMSLPCPKQSSCSFCVYSRQLGPVRIYFSSFRTPKLNTVSRYTRRNGKESSSLDLKQEHEEQQQMVFLKDPWMTTSLPSGEVIVPEVPVEVDGHLHTPRHMVSKILSGELAEDLNFDDNGQRKNPKTVGREPTKFKLEPWLRNSAPPDSPMQASSLLAVQNSLGKLRSPKSVSFGDDEPRTRTNSDLFLRVPKPNSKTLNTLPVKTNGKVSAKKNTTNGQISDKDELKELPPIPCRDLAASQRLLPKRTSHT